MNLALNKFCNSLSPTTHLATHSPTHPPIHPLTHPPTHLPTHSPTHPPTHSLTLSLTQAYISNFSGLHGEKTVHSKLNVMQNTHIITVQSRMNNNLKCSILGGEACFDKTL